ncbi:hypothetical protein BD626DRAFT_606328 [Schizophyllum amplum]|uniref:P-loop containing nucleoside triphosphate hydrolase protein n=1 Tax=Schizophyllum amplum TaxID=97359 RepID=A0A550C4Z3_9AGAR|nr:hypothetical protein BD626DRAFT_606328 [Auriculariopsis ampla]
MAIAFPDDQDVADLRPRRYQEEIFCEAQAGNRIAVLSTGSGKTYISLMLIKWVAAQPSSKGKLIVFLVPTTALVEQQGNFISANSPLRVTKKIGANALEMTDREGWADVFASCDVLVMTRAYLWTDFLNLLAHSHWSMDRTALIVFDECHHAKDRNPYNQIMRSHYYHSPAERRPRIFGLTATPIWSTANPAADLATLESNLDARIVCVQAYASELAAHTSQPREVVKTYAAPPRMANDEPASFPEMWPYLQVFDTLKWHNLNMTSMAGRYQATLDNLGPYCASWYLYREWKDLLAREVITAEGALGSAEDTETSLQFGLSKARPEYVNDLAVIQSILASYDPYFAEGQDCSPPSDEWLSTKVHALGDLLFDQDMTESQGIVFVEQRHVAICLASVLPCLPRLRGRIRCAAIVGQNPGNDGPKGMTTASQGEVVAQFRNGEVNLLIATSVAEEGLDFPACDLVVRFDSLNHSVGYRQSRGRARNKSSIFAVMIREDDEASLAKYQSLSLSESHLQKLYTSPAVEADEDPDADMLDDEAIAQRERYVVPSTGAVLTYDNAIDLLSHLCSFIPRDAYSPPPLPVYSGDFVATVRLPRSIPLPPEDLVFTGATKTTKKEAKRAAAFLAVRKLHARDVLDDYLLPVSGSRKKARCDADGRVIDVRDIPVILDVPVVQPWTIGERLWIHPVFIDDRCVAGLITGTALPVAQLAWKGNDIRLGEPHETSFDDEEREMLSEYTRLCVWYRITAKTLPTRQPRLFVVPMTAGVCPDLAAVQRMLLHPYGSSDWSAVDLSELAMVMNDNEYGKPRRFCGVREDLMVSTTVPPDSREERRLRLRSEVASATYYNFYVDKWTRKNWEARVPTDGLLVQTTLLARSSDKSYHLGDVDCHRTSDVPDGILLPQGCTKWTDMSEDMVNALEVLPPLLHRTTDIYRTDRARLSLGLPYIDRDLLIQALTLPCAGAPYNNQRLETLGDAVLELCTTVHLFNKYPHRHEGQLTLLRQICVSNKCLLTRAREVLLERFLTCESQALSVWDYVEDGEQPARCARRSFPRRSLQDCMEATLGASFLTGGIDMALHAGTALGLAFGGSEPWPRRYAPPARSTVPDLFRELQAKLGYTFRNGALLCEAATHSSFASLDSQGSYERLEFLGDAVINLVVVEYLYRRFPHANSDQLTVPRARAVCNQGLSALSVKHLQLHKSLLVNNTELSMAIARHVPILEHMPYEEVLSKGWKLDPPKVLSDVFESVIGAVFVDSGYDYDRTAAVVEQAMESLLELLSPAMPRDPVSELLIWVGKSDCREKVEFKLVEDASKQKHHPDGIAVYLHDTLIAGPVVTMNHMVSRKLACERALSTLRDPTSANSLASLCSCATRMDVETPLDLISSDEVEDGVEAEDGA